MKYFIDTEFIEGCQERPLMLKGRLGNWMLGYPKPTIDLISIGIVSENDKEYYAVSKDFNLKEAWNRHDVVTMTNLLRDTGTNKMKKYWLRDNVLKHIFIELLCKERPFLKTLLIQNKYSVDIEKDVQKLLDKDFTYKNFKRLINKYGKTNDQIAKEVKEFVSNCENLNRGSVVYEKQKSKPEFYAYYCNYDWVVFCWLFGKMLDLPTGFPMFCNDIKVLMDQKVSEYSDRFMIGNETFKEKMSFVKNKDSYPKNEKEHHALSDARFDRDLYNFLMKL